MHLLAALLLALLLAPAPAAAQQGFTLTLGPTFNSSSVADQRTGLRLSDAVGWNASADVVLPMGIGIGLSAYTVGSPDAFDVSTGVLIFLAEANYFVEVPGLPLAPYVGFNFGLGSYRLEELEGARPRVDFGDRGYQLGMRFQATPILGLDARYRRVRGTMEGEQESAFERNQVILSVTLF